MPTISRLVVASVLAVLAWQAGPAAGSWTIVAADPSTGDVGVAGASCESVTLLGLAALVPGSGAAAAQGEYTEKGRDHVWQLLQQGAGPVEIVATVTGPAFDRDSARRQYGVVSTSGGGTTAVFTGSGNEPWSGGVQGDRVAGGAATVQGTDLAGEQVVRSALDAFGTDTSGPLALTDRLMRALEAASAAGGDERCNDADVMQTARSTFIVAARGGDPPFAAPFGRLPDNVAGQPWLSLSVLNADNRENPVLALREEYDVWRSEHLAPCGDCDLAPIPVPEGDRAAPPPLDSSALLGIVVVGFGGLVIVVVVTALTIAILRRRTGRGGGSGPGGAAAPPEEGADADAGVDPGAAPPAAVDASG